MKRRYVGGTISWLIAAAVGAGCAAGGTTTGNPIEEPSVRLSVQGTRPASTSVLRSRRQSPTSWFRTSGSGPSFATATDTVAISTKDSSGAIIGTITLSDARLALKEIKLKSKDNDGEDDENKSEFPGPYVVDLIHNTINPTPEVTALGFTSFDEIELKLHKIKGDEEDDEGGAVVDSSDPLFDNSIYLEGSYTGTTGAGEVTDAPFSLTFDFDEEFKLKDTSNFASQFDLSLTDENLIIIAFRMARWTDGVDLSQVELSDGSIVLNDESEDQNEEIRDSIKENIKKSADYGKDNDGDEKLSTDEDDDELDEDDEDDEDNEDNENSEDED